WRSHALSDFQNNGGDKPFAGFPAGARNIPQPGETVPPSFPPATALQTGDKLRRAVATPRVPRETRDPVCASPTVPPTAQSRATRPGTPPDLPGNRSCDTRSARSAAPRLPPAYGPKQWKKGTPAASVHAALPTPQRCVTTVISSAK